MGGGPGRWAAVPSRHCGGSRGPVSLPIAWISVPVVLAWLVAPPRPTLKRGMSAAVSSRLFSRAEGRGIAVQAKMGEGGGRGRAGGAPPPSRGRPPPPVGAAAADVRADGGGSGGAAGGGGGPVRPPGGGHEGGQADHRWWWHPQRMYCTRTAAAAAAVRRGRISARSAALPTPSPSRRPVGNPADAPPSGRRGPGRRARPGAAACHSNGLVLHVHHLLVCVPQPTCRLQAPPVTKSVTAVVAAAVPPLPLGPGRRPAGPSPLHHS